MSLKSRAPTRIDLAGGTLDLWPIYLLIERAATVNLAINLYTEATVSPSEDRKWRVHEADSGRRCAADTPEALSHMEGAEIAGSLLRFFEPDRPLSITTRSDAPAQSGLGASSSLGVSIAGALNSLTGFPCTGDDLIELVKDIEVEILRAMTGAQDHFPPVYGGANCLWWNKLQHRREPLSVDTDAFESRFLLAYSHQPHRSGATNWEIVKRFLEGDASTRRALERSGRIACDIRDALVASDLDRVALLIGEEWQARCEMAPAVNSPELSAIIDAALEGGAISAKVCGAGGGGCMVVAVPEGRGLMVREAIVEAGGSVLDYRLVSHGLRLVADDEVDP